MKEIILNISLLLFQIISQSLVQYYFMITVTNLAKMDTLSRKLKLFTAGVSILIVTIGIFLKPFLPLNFVLPFVFMLIHLKFIIKVPLVISILASIISPVYTIIIEMLGISIVRLILNVSTEYVSQTSLGIILVVFFYLVVALAMLYVINRFCTRNNSQQNSIYTLNKKYLILAIVIILLIIAPHVFLILINRYNYDPFFMLLNFIQLTSISIFLYYYITNYVEKENIANEMKTLNMENQKLGGLVDGVRTLKHDYNNIFQALNGYLCAKQYENLEKYVAKLMKECNILNSMSVINKETFDDPAIYGVVGSKQIIASEKGINMEIDVTVKFQDINFPMAELSRIFGILLDNAIEVTEKADNSFIRLEIKNNPKKNATVIRIYNTYDLSKTIELSKIFDKGYSSKEVKSGIGLWEVSKIIKRFKHTQIYATIENKEFVQNIVIENK